MGIIGSGEATAPFLRVFRRVDHPIDGDDPTRELVEHGEGESSDQAPTVGLVRERTGFRRAENRSHTSIDAAQEFLAEPGPLPLYQEYAWSRSISASGTTTSSTAMTRANPLEDFVPTQGGGR